MSPGYLKSTWCAKERNAFLSVAPDCIEKGRIFIVNHRDTNRSEIPAEFRELKGYKFWTREGGVTRPLGHAGVKEQEYWGQLFTLGDSITKTLDEIRAARQSGPAPVTDASAVFLAHSTDDLEAREEELVSYLSQAGLEPVWLDWV